MKTMDWEGSGRGLVRSDFAKMGRDRGRTTYKNGGRGAVIYCRLGSAIAAIRQQELEKNAAGIL